MSKEKEPNDKLSKEEIIRQSNESKELAKMKRL